MATKLCTADKNPTFPFHSNHKLQFPNKTKSKYLKYNLVSKAEVFEALENSVKTKLKIEGFLPCVQRIVVVRRQQHRFLKSLFM